MNLATFDTILLLIAFILFLLTALQVGIQRINIMALGLALWVLVYLIDAFNSIT